MKQAFKYLFLAAIFGVGIWQVVAGWDSVAEGWQSSSWPTTTGTITSANIRVSHGQHGSSLIPEVSYAYAVSGATFTGTVIAPRLWGDASSAHAVMRDFPVGSHPLVHYSPAGPGRAVLIPGLHFQTFARLLFGLVPFTLAGTIGGLDLLGAFYGIDSDETITNGSPLLVPALLGFAAFFLEIGALVILWVF